jgi:hypothetical protein
MVKLGSMYGFQTDALRTNKGPTSSATLQCPDSSPLARPERFELPTPWFVTRCLATSTSPSSGTDQKSGNGVELVISCEAFERLPQFANGFHKNHRHFYPVGRFDRKNTCRN